MTKNETVSFECLFLHDTQMATLEREQTCCSGVFERLRNTGALALSGLPFSPVPPFCPDRSGKPDGKIFLAKLESSSGWIIRRIQGADEGVHNEIANAKDTSFIPGYPPLPAEYCFILGYCGENAGTVLERLHSARGVRTERDTSSTDAAQTDAVISSNARYRATLTLEVSRDDESYYGCVWTVGPARWETAE